MYLHFKAGLIYQSKSRLILIEGSDSGPVEWLQQLYTRSVEGILAWYDAKEIRITFAGEHGMRISVWELCTSISDVKKLQ